MSKQTTAIKAWARNENLVVNGSFEKATINAHRGSWEVFADGIAGWEVTSGSGLEVQVGRTAGIRASDGKHKIELDSHGSGSNSSIKQAIATEGTHTFTLSFDYSARLKSKTDTNQIEVLWDGEVIDTLNNTRKGWDTYRYEVQGNDKNDTTALEFRAAGKQDTYGGLLDNVNVTLKALADEDEPATEIVQETAALTQVSRLSYVDLGEVAIDDINGDGVPDVVSINGHYGAGIVWLDGTDSGLVNRVNYVDPGKTDLVDMNGDGIADILSTAMSGLGYYDGTSGAFTRITYNDPGEFVAADLDADGQIEILSKDSRYGNGDAVSGTVYYESDGTMIRISTHELGNFAVGNFDADAALEIVSNDGFYGNGLAISGLVTYDLDGTMDRFSYTSAEDFIVADVDENGIDELIVNNATGFPGGGIIADDAAFERLTYNDMGHFHFGDINGDGVKEVVSLESHYGNGIPVTGIVSYDLETGAMTRHSYADVDTLMLADMDNDGNDDVLVSGGLYGDGLVQLDGLIVA